MEDPFADFGKFQTSLFAALMAMTKAANALPVEDLDYYRTLDPEFGKALDATSSKFLETTNDTLKYASLGVSDFAGFTDKEDMLDRFNKAIDIVDALFEKADASLDELKGVKKNAKNAQDPVNGNATITQISNNAANYKVIHASNVQRPQMRFKDIIDNSSTTPFVWKIKEKPNAKVPLTYGLPTPAESDNSHMSTDMFSHITQNLGIGSELRELPHPYAYEIAHIEYPEGLFQPAPEQVFTSFESTQGIWVDTEEKLRDLCITLSHQKEIAVDLEHHDYRSFQGIVSLMQISTRDQDFLVDTLELRQHMWMLNDSFTNPEIVKVLHGADSDIIWLQRDFGVYIVDLFDTYHASKVLEFGSHSLAYLLKLYCSFDADKQYQLADWRIRPLPSEMYDYARADTHFLLYIFDRLRNELLTKSNESGNLMQEVLRRSAETSARKHEKEAYDAETGHGPSGWYNLYKKWNRVFDAEQFAVFKALHAWRDQVSRDEDESTRYTLPNHMLFTLSERMPFEVGGVLAACQPCPPLVRMYAQEIAIIIKNAATAVEAAKKNERVSINELPKPTHTRFDDVDVMTGKDLAEDADADEKEDMDVEGAHEEDIMMERAPVRNLDIDPTPFMSCLSSLFGATVANVPSSSLSELADKIKQTLAEESFSSFRPKVISVHTSPANDAAASAQDVGVNGSTVPALPIEPKAEPVEQPSKPKEPEVIIVSKMANAKRAAPDDTEATAQADTGDETSTKKTKKEKKNKKNNKEAAELTESPPFKAFDYSTASNTFATPKSSNEKSTKKNKKKEKTQFNPYGDIEVSQEFKKKDPSLPVAAKSGSRSMTFTD